MNKLLKLGLILFLWGSLFSQNIFAETLKENDGVFYKIAMPNQLIIPDTPVKSQLALTANSTSSTVIFSSSGLLDIGKGYVLNQLPKSTFQSTGGNIRLDIYGDVGVGGALVTGSGISTLNVPPSISKGGTILLANTNGIILGTSQNFGMEAGIESYNPPNQPIFTSSIISNVPEPKTYLQLTLGLILLALAKRRSYKNLH